MTDKTSRRRVLKTAVHGIAAVSVAASGNNARASQAAGRIAGFDHVALPLGDIVKMTAFYRALGCDVVETKGLLKVYIGANMINFHRPETWQNKTFTLRAPAALPPCGDLCFVWEGSPDSVKALLERVGAKIEVGPVARDGGRRQNGSSVYTRDPDGNLLEFLIYP